MPRVLSAHVISAAPLLLIGLSFLTVQPVLRPRRTILLKNALLAAAFILWGIVQLMEQNALSERLGSVVIVLYVLDLAWVILASVNSSGVIRPRSLRSASSQEGASTFMHTPLRTKRISDGEGKQEWR
jgi:hypothetical protein